MNPFYKHMLEAAFWTFLETFLATLAPSVAVMRVGDWNGFYVVGASAGISALAAAISLIKSLIVKNIGEKDSVFISN